MVSEVMDQRGTSSFCQTSSLFSNDIHYPIERQVGFWKSGFVPHQRLEGSNKIDAVPFAEKHRQTGLGSHANFCLQPASPFVGERKVGLNGCQYENTLFSSSLSDAFNKKMRFSSTDVLFSQSIGTVTSHLEEEESFQSLKDIEAQTIGNLLPDDDDLFSGVINDFDCHAPNKAGNDIEDFDLFSSGGGLELETDDGLICFGANKSLGFSGGIPNGTQITTGSPFPGEHPYVEQPSRTLFVRNINSNVEDSELRALFEQYGDVRTLYSACKHRGFVMVSYFDIRAACNAIRALQNRTLRHQKLDIHFSIPKDNPSEKDTNQGAVGFLNLDSSVSNDDVHQIFGVYGEIKEIHETPYGTHHKVIEFYDVRAAENAIQALNGSDIAGKQIKLEPSCLGGARQCLVQQHSPEFALEETSGIHRRGSSPFSSSSGCLVPIASSGHSAIRDPISRFVEMSLHATSSSVALSLPSPDRVASLGNHKNQMVLSETNLSPGHMNFGFQSMSTLHSHSFPEYRNEAVANAGAYNSLSCIPSMSVGVNPRSEEGFDYRHMSRVVSGGNSFELNDGVLGASGNESCPLQGQQYIWSNSNALHHHSPSSMLWQNSPSFANGVQVNSHHQIHGLPRVPSHLLNTILPLEHQVGSAPTINPSMWERRHAHAGNSTGTTFHQGSLRSMGFKGCSAFHPLDLNSYNIFQHGASCTDPSVSSNVGMPSTQQKYQFPGRQTMIPMSSSLDASNERLRSRRSEANSNQAESKKQYELDIDRILQGEDTRTTLMIKNIPNKYTSKMLLATIDEQHRGTYDFIYLPIDFKNKCNVGYAFINLIDPMKIIPFYQSFNGKKWEKFNSEKVASLAYARIQGRAALIAHFQNSSLMNEDKRCRPILFHADGPNAGDQEPFPIGSNIRPRSSKMRTNIEDNQHGIPSPPSTGDDGTDSSSSDSTKAVE